jgi:hypothetical protein
LYFLTIAKLYDRQEDPNFYSEGLRHAPRVNQPFVPDTAPVRQTRSAAQPATSNQEIPSSHTPSFQAAEGSTSHIVEGEATQFTRIHVDSEAGPETKEMYVSTRDVYTPGNRPEQFRRQGKEIKQVDFYDPYYPLQHLEVNRGEHNHIFCCIQAYSQYSQVSAFTATFFNVCSVLILNKLILRCFISFRCPTHAGTNLDSRVSPC